MATNVTIRRRYKNPDYYNQVGTGTIANPSYSTNYNPGSDSGSSGDVDLTNYMTIEELDASFYTIPEIDASFYTKGLLDAGQLDTRYYTETELDVGQLDNRYYTETESDSLFVNVSGDTMTGDLNFGDNDGIFLGDSAKAMYVRNTGSYLQFDRGTASTAPNFYITSDVPTTYIYSSSIYLGNTSGDVIQLRGNRMYSDYWDFTTGGVLKIDEIQSNSTAFVSGSLGSGLRIKDVSGRLKIECDDLKVRGSMEVTEFIISKIKAENGSLVITNTAKASSDIQYDSTYGYYFESDGSANGLQAGDNIVAQAWNGPEVYRYDYIVNSVSNDNNKVYVSNTAIPNYGNYEFLDWTNVSISSAWAEGSNGLAFTAGATNQYFRSGYFDLSSTTGSTIKIEGTWDDDTAYGGQIKFGIYNSSNTLISNQVYRYADAEEVYDTLTISGTKTSNCYLRVTVTSLSGYSVLALSEFQINAEVYSYITGHTFDGKEFVQFGNRYDTDRQSLIYLTIADTNSPRISFYDNVTSSTLSVDNEVTRLGNLDGINDSDVGGALYGQGLYSRNAYLKGKIWANEGGEIANWTIASDAIYTGTKKTSDGVTSSGVTIASNGSIRGTEWYLNSDGDSGFNQIEQAVFKTDDDDYGIKISGGHIWENDLNGQGYVLINYKGYNGGTTQYRSTVIGDGKGSQMWYVNPDTTAGGYGINHWAPTKFNSGWRLWLTNIASSHTVLERDMVISNYDTTTTNTVTLPSSPADGQMHIIKNRYNSGNRSLTVYSSSGIDAGTVTNSITLQSGSSGTFVWDSTATNWLVVSAYSGTVNSNNW